MNDENRSTDSVRNQGNSDQGSQSGDRPTGDGQPPERPPSKHIDETRAANIPDRLKEHPRWVCWAWRLVDGRWTKPPIDPKTGHAIDKTDPRNWMSFDAARAARRWEYSDGEGIYLGVDDGLAVLDLDHVGKPGGCDEAWAKVAVGHLDSYTEMTPSGDGLRTIVLARLPRDAKGKTRCRTAKRTGIEFYDEKRYITVTGNIVVGAPLAVMERTAELADLHADVFAEAPGKGSGKSAKGRRTTDDVSDDALIDKARTAKGGSKFRALFDDGDTSGYAGDDSAADLALCAILAFWCRGPDPDRIDRLFRRSKLYRDKWDRADYRERTITAALEGRTEYYKPSANGHPRGRSHSSHRVVREEIEVNTERHRVVAEVKSVMPRDPGLFVRGETLVRMERESEDTITLPGGVEVRDAMGSVRIAPISDVELSCRLTALIDFYAWRNVRGEAISGPVHPPDWLCKAIVRSTTFPGVRKLNGVVEIPFVRRDGTLFVTPGYDPETGFYYAPSIAIDPLPESLCRIDAAAAAVKLFKIVEQFPFASEDDKAVWLADILTVVERPIIDGPVPGFVYIGNRAGIGKGFLINVVGVIATGRIVPTTSYPESNEEAIKVKMAIALSAKSLVHFDNLDEGKSYGSGPLDSMLTSIEIDDRVLGTARNSGPIRLLITPHISGNRIVPGKDAHRRWLPSHLVTVLETPEERDDLEIADLIAYTREHRSDLVRYALIILRAHALAGRPTGKWGALGSFEAWDPIVRGAVWFATGRDCNATRKTVAAESPDRKTKLALLDAWSRLPSGAGPDGYGLTAMAAHKLASEPQDLPMDIREELVEALMRLSKDGKIPSPAAIGNKIRTMAATTFDGKMFVKVNEVHQSAVWRVDTVFPNNPESTICTRGSDHVGESRESWESDSPHDMTRNTKSTSDYKESFHQDRPKRSPQDSRDSPTWRCENRGCRDGSRWWRSIHGVVNCMNCCPPAFSGLVAEEGEA